MKNLYIMVGLSASGKSTYAKDLSQNSNAIIISSDNIRAELGDVSDQYQNKKVFDIYYKRLKQHLQNETDVILDATNLTIKSRKQAIEMGKRFCYNVTAIVIVKDIDSCIEHDKLREYSVSKNVILNQAKKFQIPFKGEGFNEIRIIDNIIIPTLDKYEPREFVNLLMNFEQSNKYHNMTLGEHMNEVTKFAIDNNYPTVVIDALKYHDIGKLFTQTFDEDEQAHYYGHENYGAYIMLEWCKFHLMFSLSVIELINYHMLVNNWTTEKTHNKYKKLFGEKMYNNLLLMNKADKYRGE